MKNLTRFLFPVLLLLSISCTPKKHLTSGLNEEEWIAGSSAEQLEFISGVQSGLLEFSTLQTRAKGYLTVNEKENHEVNVQIRIKKDEAIWVSATALLGLEVGRVLITPDSILVINRMESVYVKEAFRVAGQWLGEELDFQALQGLLVGNAPDLSVLTDMVFAKNTGGGGYFSERPPANGTMRQELIFDHGHRLIWWQGQQLDVRHAFRPDFLLPVFPAKTTLAIEARRLKLLLTMDYSQVELNQAVDFPFSIPKGYRQIH